MQGYTERRAEKPQQCNSESLERLTPKNSGLRTFRAGSGWGPP